MNVALTLMLAHSKMSMAKNDHVAMPLFVQHKQVAYPFDVQADTIVSNLKHTITQSQWMDYREESEFTLWWQNRELRDGEALSDAGVCSESVLEARDSIELQFAIHLGQFKRFGNPKSRARGMLKQLRWKMNAFAPNGNTWTLFKGSPEECQIIMDKDKQLTFRAT